MMRSSWLKTPKRRVKSIRSFGTWGRPAAVSNALDATHLFTGLAHMLPLTCPPASQSRGRGQAWRAWWTRWARWAWWAWDLGANVDSPKPPGGVEQGLPAIRSSDWPSGHRDKEEAAGKRNSWTPARALSSSAPARGLARPACLPACLPASVPLYHCTAY